MSGQSILCGNLSGHQSCCQRQARCNFSRIFEMSFIDNLLEMALNELRWLDGSGQESDFFDFVLELCKLKDNVDSAKVLRKIELLSDTFGIYKTKFQRSLVSVLKIAINVLQLKEKGNNALLRVLSTSGLSESFGHVLVEKIEKMCDEQALGVLLKQLGRQPSEVKDFDIRMDINMSQRSLPVQMEPRLQFLWNVYGSDEKKKTFCMSPEMLVKLSEVVDEAVKTVNRTERTNRME